MAQFNQDTTINGNLYVTDYITVGSSETVLDFLHNGSEGSEIEAAGSEYDSWTNVTFGNPVHNTSYISGNDVGWSKIGRIVYIKGYFDVSTAVRENTSTILFSALPEAYPSPSSHGCILHCGSASGDRYVKITSSGTITTTALSDLPAGRYGISGVYISRYV